MAASANTKPSAYSKTVRLPASRVEFALLRQLEAYLLSLVTQEAGGTNRLRFKIGSGADSETFTSVDSFPYSLMPDSTRTVALEFDDRTLGLHIKLSFDVTRESTEADLAVAGIRPRERADSILAEILRIVDPFRTSNGWLSPNSFAQAMFFGSPFVVLVAIAQVVSQSNALDGPFGNSLLVALLTPWAYLLLAYFTPYSTFPTLRNSRRGRFVNWLLLGLAGTIVFGMAVPFIVDWLGD